MILLWPNLIYKPDDELPTERGLPYDRADYLAAAGKDGGDS